MSKTVRVLILVGVCMLGIPFVFGGGAPGGGGGGGFGGFGGGGGNFTPPSAEDMARMRLEFMSRRLDDANLSAAEKTAALDSMKVKNDARTKLQEKMNSLREVSDDQKSTDVEVSKALNEFVKSQIEFNTAVGGADLALAKKVSVRTRAKLTVLGVLENGIGAGGGGFGGGGRAPRGGGGPGGQGGGPGGQGGGPGGGRGNRGDGGAGGGSGTRSGALDDLQLDLAAKKLVKNDDRKLDKKIDEAIRKSETK